MGEGTGEGSPRESTAWMEISPSGQSPIGVTLGFLQLVLAQNNQTHATEDIVREHIVPFLSSPECRQETYVLGSSSRWPDNPAFGRATVFISHAWRCSFAGLVSALERREADRLAAAAAAGIPAVPVFFWLDIFSKDQFVINSGWVGAWDVYVWGATPTRHLLSLHPHPPPPHMTHAPIMFYYM